MSLPFLQKIMYQGSTSRDLRLDWLRGFALFVMTVNHIGGYSYLYHLTGNNNFYISAAEGFYFISGLTLGIVFAKDTLGGALTRLLARVVVVYRTTVLIAIGFAAFSLYTGLTVWGDPFPKTEPLGQFALYALTLQKNYHGSDILAAYVIYMLMAPIALYQMFHKRAWLVALVSLGLYGFTQVFGGNLQFPIDQYYGTWQIFFFMGLAIGFHRADMGRLWARVPWLRDGLSALILIAAIWFIWMQFSGNYFWPNLPQVVLGQENKIAMGPARLAIVSLFMMAFYVFATWFWKPLNAISGWLFIPLGSASLWTFTWQLIAIVVLYNIPGFYKQDYQWQGTLWQLLGIGIIWGSIQGYRWFKKQQKGKETAEAIKPEKVSAK